MAFRVEGQPVQIRADRLYARHAADECVAHSNWLHKRSLACFHFLGLPDQVGCPFQQDQYLASYASLANHENNIAHRAIAVLTSAETPRDATSTVPLDLMGAAT
jgi:hypothetical protein